MDIAIEELSFEAALSLLTETFACAGDDLMARHSLNVMVQTGSVDACIAEFIDLLHRIQDTPDVMSQRFAFINGLRSEDAKKACWTLDPAPANSLLHRCFNAAKTDETIRKMAEMKKQTMPAICLAASLESAVRAAQRRRKGK